MDAGNLLGLGVILIKEPWLEFLLGMGCDNAQGPRFLTKMVSVRVAIIRVEEDVDLT